MNITKEELKELNQLMESYQKTSESLRLKQQKFEEDNALEINIKESLTKAIEETREKIKEHALLDYKETKQKKLMGGIGIREITKLVYKVDEAIAWAKQNMPICVQEALDKKTFETFAKSTPIPIVEIKKNESVTFPSTMVLEEENV